MTKRSWLFVVVYVALAAAMFADRALGLDLGIGHVLAPLSSI